MLKLRFKLFIGTSGKLINDQLEILKLFHHDLSGSQLLEIKNILAKYFAQTASTEMDKLWDANNWNNDIMNQWACEHLNDR